MVAVAAASPVTSAQPAPQDSRTIWRSDGSPRRRAPGVSHCVLRPTNPPARVQRRQSCRGRSWHRPRGRSAGTGDQDLHRLCPADLAGHDGPGSAVAAARRSLGADLRRRDGRRHAGAGWLSTSLLRRACSCWRESAAFTRKARPGYFVAGRSIASSAWPMSAIRSSGSSMPTDSRTRPSPMPSRWRSSALRARCEEMAG